MMHFTYYGHSCFAVQIKGKKILFDPFITPNDLAKNIDVNQVAADYIFLSHGHEDHIADCITIAERNRAKIICSYEIHVWLNDQEITNTHPMNTGGKWDFDFGTVKCVVAQHSGGLPDGSYGGNPMGFVFTSEEGNFYYSGDTALTLDMQLVPQYAKLNFAVLPIGDNFTMGIEDAIQAARFVQCNEIIGVHYDTFGFIKIDHEKAVKAFSDQEMKLHLMQPGETLDI
ncbi:metal-dependent hydrolase [Agriterribacter sp.]|uniref:metal-dependent hydrolase n=1 Tax=Agriterribacter sp. TaxID=2821509 RepID=UPI002B50DF2D|nr:metal-dependent hydrolase [Agriterribacter sp.]HRP56952.1 metal-dependent hydrolase [Agriterribacter sp.]